MKLTFGDIVVVQGNLIGVVVKCWGVNSKGVGPSYEVYVRNWNSIEMFIESDLERYLVRHKELDDAEMEYQSNALNA